MCFDIKDVIMKSILNFWFVLALMWYTLFLTSCKTDQLPDSPKIILEHAIPSKIILTSKKNLIDVPGGSDTLHITVSPGNADQSYLLQIVEGFGIADLTNNIVTARKNGIIKIKATTKDQTLADTCIIYVKNQKDTLLENVHIIQDTTIRSTHTDASDIFVIQPKVPYLLILKNNYIEAQNNNAHILLLGTEFPGMSDRMLDNAIISGNKLIWKGTDLTDSNEGVLFGYSINALIEYNFVVNCPYGTPVKSSGLSYTSGGTAYNVYGSSFKVGVGSKGTSGVKFYNNTFYNTRDTGEGVVGSVYINSNSDIPGKTDSAANCEIFNNIFYTKHQVANIYCDAASLKGLKCDYNIYYCESGEPVFRISGNTITFSTWKAMGYDTHSQIINPQFKDLTFLIPASRLNYGQNLGDSWRMGLDPSNKWEGGDPVLSAQDNQWQVGAFVIK